MKNKPEFSGQDAVTIISTGVLLEGKISSNGNIRIDGLVKGNINAKGNVTIGSHGEINGEIDAQMISLAGKVTGTMKANDKVMLESTAVLKGDIVAKILVIEEGAAFDGNSSMNSNGRSAAAKEAHDNSK